MDVSSPGFVVSVIATNPEIRIEGKTDPKTLGKILDRMTDVTERVISFTYEDDEKEHDVLKLTVDNSDLYFFDHPAWVKGNLVKFLFGYPGRLFGPKYHVVDSVRGFHTLTITCVEDAALANKAKTRRWFFPVGVILQQLVFSEQAFGQLTGLVVDGSLPGNVVDVMQSKQTDWQFVQKLGEMFGGREVFISDNAFHFVTRQFGQRPRRSYEYWYGEGNVLSFDIKEWRTTDRPAETTVCGRDPLTRKTLRSTGSNTETERTSLGNQNSVSITADKAGALQRAPAGSTINTTAKTSQAEVKTEADARYRRQEQGEIKASMTIIGDPELPAKSVIKVAGISRQLSGLFYVQKITHKIDRSGYESDLELLRNAVTAMPTTTPPTVDKIKAKENTKEPTGDRRPVIATDRAGNLINRAR